MGGLLTGKRIAVLGSNKGLGLAVARDLAGEGASVIGIDADPVYDHLDTFLRADPRAAGLMADVAAALPEGLDGLALFPALAGDVAEVIAQGITAPLTLARALAPRMAAGAAIVTRAYGPHAERAGHQGAVRAALSLRAGGEAGFAKLWNLQAEPIWAPRIAGWANLAFAQSATLGPRVNAVTPARPDGHFDEGAMPTAQSGPEVVAQAVTYLLSDRARGVTGANLAVDGGRSARIEATLLGH